MFVCEQRLTLNCFKINLKQKLPLYNVHITLHCAVYRWLRWLSGWKKITLKLLFFKSAAFLFVLLWKLNCLFSDFWLILHTRRSGCVTKKSWDIERKSLHLEITEIFSISMTSWLSKLNENCSLSTKYPYCKVFFVWHNVLLEDFRYFTKGFFTSGNFPKVFFQVATSQMCNFPSGNF